MSTRKRKPAKRQVCITKEDVDSAANAVFTAFTSDLGRPFLAGSRNVRAVVQSWNPLKYDFSFVDPADFYRSYVPSQFFKKWFYTSELSSNPELQAKAFDKFYANLERGKEFNEKLRSLAFDSYANSVIELAALKIQRVLGELDLVEWMTMCGHGPNATVTVPRERSYLDHKTCDMSGTLSAQSLFFELYLPFDFQLKAELGRLLPGKPGEGFETVPGDRLSFVPKRHDSFRTMSVQPTVNMFLQLGLGRVITSRLLTGCNIDLSTQPECHKHLGRIASSFTDVGLATVDWSEASDRIWVTLCERLLPPDWFTLAMSLRCSRSSYQGKTYPLPMIGTMGNGFTFPLQTLIFWGLLSSICDIEGEHAFISVFGDDCIVPSSIVPKVEAFATEIGWQMNAEKTFSVGGFRESCGADWYRGLGCRPFMIERPNDTSTRHAVRSWIYIVYNGLKRVLKPLKIPTPALDEWVSRMHRDFRLGAVLIVPPRYPDGSGVRCNKPASHLSGAYAPSLNVDGQIHFRALLNRPGSRRVWEYPFYHGRLKGAPQLKDFKPAKLPLQSDKREMPSIGSSQDVPFDGTTPLKRCRIYEAKQCVHTWTYWIDHD